MIIRGNLDTADKFYVILDDNSIECVPNIKTAKTYSKDPNLVNWYNKEIFATNEDVIRGKDNKLYLRSKIPEELIFDKTDHYEQFKKQSEEYIKSILLNKIKADGFESLEEVLSWKDSQIIQFNQYALKLLEYRDKCYIFYLNLLENNNNLLKEGKDLNKISELYTYFIENFPKVPNKKYF